MKINLKILKKKFPLKIEYLKKRPSVLVSDRLRLDHNLRSIILAFILNKSKKINPYVISDKTNFEKDDFFKIFNFKKVNIKFRKSKILFFNIGPKILLSIIFFYLLSIFKKNKIKWLINDYKCEEINIGDLVYDTYIRYGNKFIKPNIYCMSFLKILFIGIYKTYIIKYYTKKLKVSCIISNQKGYLSFGNLLLRYGAKNNYLTILNGYNFIKIYKNYRESMSTPWRINSKLLSKKQINKNKIINFYKNRNIVKQSGSYVDLSTLKKAYGNKKNYKFDIFLKKQKDKYKYLNLFALHCFSDAPHVCGELIFNDFYDQFIETIKFIRSSREESLWLIKPHPARNDYGEKGIVEDKLKLFNIKNVILCPDNINNSQLFNHVDNLVTGVSTISLEFACHGKKSIISGNAPYFHKKLFYQPKTKIEYFKKLKNINYLNNRLSKKEIFLSKKILYILENHININLRKSSLLPDYYLKQFKSDKNYLKKLIKNLSNNNNYNIINDPMYKDIEKIITTKLGNY